MKGHKLGMTMAISLPFAKAYWDAGGASVLARRKGLQSESAVGGRTTLQSVLLHSQAPI